MTTFLALLGSCSAAFALTAWNCDPMLSGLAKRLTARRMALVAYRAEFKRVMDGKTA